MFARPSGSAAAPTSSIRARSSPPGLRKKSLPTPKSVRCTWVSLSGSERFGATRGQYLGFQVITGRNWKGCEQPLRNSHMLKPSLQLKLGQQLTMTPQLQQAIRLLQLPALELQAHIRELLESNVMLEPMEELEADRNLRNRRDRRPNSPSPRSRPAPSRCWMTAGTCMAPVPPRPPGTRDDDERQQEYADDSGQSLQEHLLWQLELASLAPRELAIARALVDSISDDGYLTESLEEIAQTLRPELECSAPEVSAVLRIVQALDPPGIGARSVSECLELQLRQLDPATPGYATAIEIARHHLELVAERELTLLKRELRTTRGGARQCAGAGALVPPAPRLDRQRRQRRIRGARCVRAPHRARLGGRAQPGDPAARTPQSGLRQPHRPQRQPREHARAAAGSALAAQEPGDPPRDAHEGRPLDRRAPDGLPRAGR